MASAKNVALMEEAIETWLVASVPYRGWAWIALVDAVNSGIEANWRAVHRRMFDREVA